MKLRKMKVLIAFQHYRVGDELEVNGVFGDFLEDRHYAEYISSDPAEKKKPRRGRKPKEQSFVAI